MNFSNYDKDTLEGMSIHALRVMGRSLGVDAPTMKSKKDLIDSMVKILESNGGVFVPADKTAKAHKGRPPKRSLIFGEPIVPAQMFVSEAPKEPVRREEVKILDGITTSPENAFIDADIAQKRRGRPVGSTTDYQKKYRTNPGTDLRRRRENGYDNNGMQNNYKDQNNYNQNNFNQNNFNQNNFKDQNNYRDQNNIKDGEDDVALAQAVIEQKEGVLEIMPDGYGFLRAKNFESGDMDAYVSAQKIRRFGLRKGDKVKAEARKQCENRPAGVVNVLEVNGLPPESAFSRKSFDYLTPIYPNERYKLEIPGRGNDYAIRAIDMIAPIGKGQRAMIVSPPKAGKTTLLKTIANSLTANYPEVTLLVLLIDERPEEVTDMQRNIKGEVIYSTFDEMPEHHTKAAELVLERAKRLVEFGQDVIILMDSLTRLARAYNLTISPTGRTLSGGIDPGALHSPKRFFGAARNIENGGSLTIIATALVDTGSRMDDVIYEEFKGTGNMEIHLDRRLSEKRIFPAIDLNRSGTRREELLLDQNEIQGIWGMRKMLSNGDGGDATEQLINMLIKTKTNKDFIEQLNLQVMSMQKQGYLV